MEIENRSQLRLEVSTTIEISCTHVTPGGPDAAIDEPLPHEPEPENRDNDDPADQQLETKIREG